MKIGILGNTNNYPFTFAMLLRELGQEVVMMISEKELLHRPESRHPEFNKQYPPWIVDFSHLKEWDFVTLSPKLGPALDALSDCDAFILNSYWISLLPFLNAPGIVLLTGSDLSYYANFDSILARTGIWDPSYRNSPEGKLNLDRLRDLIDRQRQGIRQAIAVRSFPRGLVSADDALLDEIGVPDSKRVFLQASNLDRVDYVNPPRNEPLRVYCGARITWKLPVEPGRSILDYKGSDILIHGLGLFYRETGIRLEICLVKKGLHVAELMPLIEEEGLSEQITWLDEMSLFEFWNQLSQSDIIFDQLSDSAIGGAGLDGMATGRPVIGNAKREMFEDLFGEPSPICQARTPEEVCTQLKRLVYDPTEREKVGLAGRKYVEKYFNPRLAAKTILEILQKALPGSNGHTSHRISHSYYLQRLDAIQQELLDAQQALSHTGRSFSHIQQELSQTQQELSHTQQALLHAEQELKQIKPNNQILRKIIHFIVQKTQGFKVP